MEEILTIFPKIPTAAWLQSPHKLPTNLPSSRPSCPQRGAENRTRGLLGWVPPGPARTTQRWASSKGSSSFGKSTWSPCRKPLLKENPGGRNLRAHWKASGSNSRPQGRSGRVTAPVALTLCTQGYIQKPSIQYTIFFPQNNSGRALSINLQYRSTHRLLIPYISAVSLLTRAGSCEA